MPTIDELHRLLSQAERTVQARADDLADAQDHQERVARACSPNPYDKKWSHAKNITKRAHQKYGRALREAGKLRRAIRNAAASGANTSKADPMPFPDIVGAQVTLFQVAINKWREQCVACFTNYPALRIFPLPPVNRPCGKQTCRKETRALPVCRCQIRHAFRRVGDLNLKKERLLWHPDRFAACLEHKEEFQAMAKEIFIVVDEMYRQA